MIELYLCNWSVNFELLIHHPFGKCFPFSTTNRNGILCLTARWRIIFYLAISECHITITTANKIVVIVFISIAFGNLFGNGLFIRLRLWFAFFEKSYKHQCYRCENEHALYRPNGFLNHTCECTVSSSVNGNSGC